MRFAADAGDVRVHDGVSGHWSPIAPGLPTPGIDLSTLDIGAEDRTRPVADVVTVRMPDRRRISVYSAASASPSGATHV